MNNPNAPQTPEPPKQLGEGPPAGFSARLRSVAIVPMVVLPLIAIVVITTLGFIVARVVRDGGLMPRPTALDTYSCVGFASPLQLAFRHGMDVVQLRAGDVTVWGELLNGKIAWEEPARAQAQLGFAPPVEIVFDDVRALRVVDASQAARTERVCERLQ
ncbi:MAG: hypothetical protein HYX43_07175 [Burkholderiales bacterium]|nr:hypothetical protein [Burkholderiales bacterium]